MSLKKTNASQLSHDDIVRALDMEEANISTDICRKLRQNRYKAIDHASIIDKRDYMRVATGWGVASLACIGLIGYLVNQHSVNEAIGIPKEELAKKSLPSTNSEQELSTFNLEREPKASGANESNLIEETKQKEEAAKDLEIYEWLYNNYG